MYLQSVILHGFKTFSGRTTLDLRPGITAIVGPNGSGKSNIADAVRWALGETNLRHVRCRSTDELIFAGNARRSSLGLAEVSLVFVNDGDWLAIPYNEVRITRRAYRSGENEFLLNGNRVRLKDIVDLLAGASIHAGGHVVVSQGLVDAVLSLRSEERRPVFENLAGLKQFYLRRDEAEGRLTQTEANLVHVDALVAEITPQLESLAQQSEVLRTYRAAESELRRLQQATFGAQAARLLARSKVAQERDTRATEDLDFARGRAQELGEADEALVSRLNVDRQARESLLQQVRVEQALAAALQRDRDVAVAQLSAAEERSEFSRREYARLVAAAEREQGMLRQAAQSLDEIAGELSAIETRLAGGRTLHAESIRQRDRAAAEDRRTEGKSEEAARSAQRLVESLAGLAAAVDSGLRELERQDSQVTVAEVALGEAELALAGAKAIHVEREAARSVALEVEEKERVHVEVLRRAVSASQTALRDAAHEREDLATRCAVLRSWLEGLDRFGAPVRRLGVHGAVRGIVAQAIRVDPDWRGPIAALLGSRNDALITDELVELLPAAISGGGRVRILASAGGTLRERDVPCPEPGAAEDALSDLLETGAVGPRQVLGWASDVCHDASNVKVCCLLKLDRILLLSELDALLRCYSLLPGLRLGAVVKDHAVAVAPDGIIVCGVDAHAAETIARTQEVADLEKMLREVSERETAARESLGLDQEQLAAAQQAHESARKMLDAADLALSRTRDEVRFQERLVYQTNRAVVAANTVRRRLAEELTAKRQRLVGEQSRSDSVRAEAEVARSVHETARRELVEAQQRLSTAAAACRDDELAASRLRDRVAAAQRIVAEQRGRVASIEDDLARYAIRERAAVSQIAELRTAVEAATSGEERARIAVQRNEADLRPIESRLHDEDARYAAHRASYHEATQQLARAQAAHDAAHRDHETVMREIDVLRAQVSAELRCDLDELGAEPVPHGAMARVRALRAELSAMGPVNARAEEDYTSAGERLTFLRTQSADLREGVARLRSIIEDANATVRDRFTSTVEQLDKHFIRYFVRLFGGGSCHLSPEYDERGLPAGVEVRAQPPGKRTRDLALLSGGERALVAIALLFAMLNVLPVPFCLLDEVEAALDEANTGRFGAILREMSETIQFIIVTHNRGTMLHADRLYGITMSEAGISTIASLELAGSPG